MCVTVGLVGLMMLMGQTAQMGLPTTETQEACIASTGCFMTQKLTNQALETKHVRVKPHSLPPSVTRAFDIYDTALPPWGLLSDLPWQVEDIAVQLPSSPCELASAMVHWNSARVNLTWLKIQLGQVAALQPQRCVMTPRVCLMDC